MKIAIFAREVGDIWRDRFILIINKLIEREVELYYYHPFYSQFLKEFGENFSLMREGRDHFFHSGDNLPSDIDFFLSFGGDGTFLEALTLVQKREIPIVGINFGRLGFLTSVDSAASTEWIDLLFNREYQIERRAVLEVKTPLLDDKFCRYALNEVTFQRRQFIMLAVYVKVNGKSLPPYWSDGLILSTPTGSTAYSLSVGGPIIIPTVDALTLAPISPHNLNVRPLVIPGDSTIEVYIESRGGDALLGLDNRSVLLPQGERVVVTKADFSLLYLSFSSEGFIAALQDKLMWGEDKRNV